MSAVVSFDQKPKSLVQRMADRFGVDADKMMVTLKATAFKTKAGDPEVSNEQMMALLVVSEQYGLNPWTKEIYAFPDKRNGIVPVVGVDGWSRIINERPELDGIEFRYSEKTIEHKGKICNEWVECVIYRKDRSHPTIAREYFAEVVRKLSYECPWDTHPNRLHRHKALIQCARIAFGFGGIYEQDEAERIEEAVIASEKKIDPRGEMNDVDWEMVDRNVKWVTDTLAMDKDELGIAEALREVDTEMQKFQDTYIATCDKLAKLGVITKAAYKKYLKVGLERDHGG